MDPALALSSFCLDCTAHQPPPSTCSMAAGALSTQDLNEALGVLGGWVAQTNKQGSQYAIGADYQYSCLFPAGSAPANTAWQEQMFGIISGGTIYYFTQQMACSLPMLGSSTGSAPTPSDFCSSLSVLSPGNLGYVATLFSNIVGCGTANSTGATNTCGAQTLAQSPQYIASLLFNPLVNRALLSGQVCNNIALHQNSSSCDSSWNTPPYFDLGYCNAYSPGLNNEVALDAVEAYTDALVYNASTGGLPWYFYMWRNYDMSTGAFSPAQQGLLDSTGPLYNEPSWANAVFGFNIGEPDDVVMPTTVKGLYTWLNTTIPPLMANLGVQIVAPQGQFLVAASFQAAVNPWMMYYSFEATGRDWDGQGPIDKSGNSNLLNMAMLSATLTPGGASGFTLSLSNASWIAMPVAGGSSPPDSMFSGLPSNCYQPNLPYYAGSWIPQANTPAACALNPQYISLMPTTVPINYVVVGIGFIQWQCSNYQGVAEGYGPNMVLGLELVGREVIYDNVTNEITFGEDSNFSNYGYCGSSTIPASLPCTESSPTVWPPEGNFYPPSDQATQPQSNGAYPTGTHYDALQLYSNVVYPSYMDFACKGYSRPSACRHTSLAGTPSGTAYFYADDITSTNGPDTPSLVQGAAFWIKCVGTGACQCGSPIALFK